MTAVAQVCQIIVPGLPVVSPVFGVVDVALVAVPRATREPASAVSYLQPVLEILRNPVAVAPHGEHRTGFGVGQQANEARRACREASRAVSASIGLLVLLQFTRFAVMTGIASLVIVAVYPFMKRITWWPQVVLGLAFSWGALMGFAVHARRIDLTALVLYAGSIAWVIGYDTIYAHQDAEDDALIGVKSTARLFGARTHRALALFYSLAVVLIGVALALARRAMAGMDRTGSVRRASGPAYQAIGYRRSRALPEDFQIQPRCGPVAVCRIAGGCGDALNL